MRQGRCCAGLNDFTAGAEREMREARLLSRAAVRRQLLFATLTSVVSSISAGAEPQFDHLHTAWTRLLQRHVVLAPPGYSSGLRYTAMQSERELLVAYLASLSAVSVGSYRGWSKPQQLAFLINAYNAYTIDLVLSRYPDLRSIKELGSMFQSPWKKAFFKLLGEERSLDDVEHGLIRAPGEFDDPRIHVALVCASAACPMLRNEAFIASRIDAQLDDSMLRFLSDRRRNRFEGTPGQVGVLRVSKIFDWYRTDFERGRRSYSSLQSVFSRYAEALADAPAARADIRAGRYRLDFFDYDWSLNDAR